MDDLVSLFDRIRQQPDDEAGWLALATHLHEHGDQDLATLIRSHWPVYREGLQVGDSAKEALHRMRTVSLQDLVTLARKARERGGKRAGPATTDQTDHD